ncbi:kinase-like protein [Daedalea quercina L-15889]|uniref:Kinase-like protein n=1 Tax=Daedalea quercina L-15889 TaxID=1314783 RepID=A0A165PZC4_9APHY|nr:kinase-like protein [Daedalea quercina L-15889]
MSFTEDYATQTDSRRINASDFEVIRPVRRGQAVPRKGELVIGRRADTGRLYAIKVFRKASLGADQGAYTGVRTEQAALRLVTERAVPCAMQLYWSFQDEKALYLIMNYVASDLRTFVECHGVLALSDATILASQLVQGLMALHAIGIVHCNINPNTIFIENGFVLIAEFGHAQVGVDGLTQLTGEDANGQRDREVEPYHAPELLLGWIPHVASDWWGFGLVLCYMLTAKHPFLEPRELETAHLAIILSKVLHGELPKWLVDGEDVAILDLLRKCLERNPALRLSGGDVKTHPFFSDVSSDDLNYGTVNISEFGVCRPAVSSAKKYGTIRKFSSLNFDLDTLDTVPASSGRINPLGISPRHQQRQSSSTFTSPFTSTPGTARNKLRKKARPENTPASVSQPPPILDLPPGIEQIGHGIGYTRRADPVYSRLSFPTVAPRSCQAIFSRECFPGLSPRHGRKKTGGRDTGRYEQPENGGPAATTDEYSEDPMDAVMREVYGPRWNLGSSSDLSHAGGTDPRAYLALVKATQAVGLGIGDAALDATREQQPIVPAELSTLSPASTLRLVSPSVRDLRCG